MSEIKVNLRQCSQGVDVNINQTEQDITASFYSGIMLVHDYTLQGNGTSSTPLGISQEILDRIDDVGKVNDVYVNGVSVLAADKIAYVIVPTNVSDLNNDLNFQTLTQVSNAISVHNESSTAHADIRQDIANVSDSISTSIATHNTSDSAHQDIRNLISDLSEWTTESYTATTTNFVVGNTYTVDSAFQRTASLFAGAFDEISTINSKIPAQATTQNQLADKAFVNSSIASSAANFRGNWLTWADVPTNASLYPVDYSGSTTPTNNDYLVVNDASDYVSGELTPIIRVQTVATHPSDVIIKITDVLTGDVYEFHHRTTQTITPIGETGFYVRYGTYAWRITADRPFIVDGTLYLVGSEWFWNFGTTIDETADGYRVYSGSWRFVYSGTWSVEGKNGWYPAYRIGNAFTAEQQAAIDSGITKNMVDNYVNPTSTANTAYNKRITALETDKRDIINSANKVYATDSQGGNLDTLEYSQSATASTIAQRTADGELTVATPTSSSSATTKDYVDTIASTKQNTLTAGTNISIVNDVISSTAQESFFRGNFNEWSDVPTNANLYQEDIHGNRIPKDTDFIVVEDASQFIPSGSLMHKLVVENLHSTKVFTIRITDETGVSKEYYYQPYQYGFIAIDDYYSLRYAPGAPGHWYIKTNDGSPIVVKGTTYQSGSAQLCITSDPATPFDVGMPPSAGQYQGAWRFAYYGVWSTDGITGWTPQYKIENTLPIATSTEPGIAKLYNTTGSNTDGAIDQNGTTTAINTAVSTHNTASNAHSNIRGTANGLATLDANAKVPLTQMNDALVGNVSYQGLWNAATNDPFLPNPSGELPTGYTQYGWIKTVSGTPYIDTGISYDYANEDEITVETKLNYLSTARAGYGSFGFTSGNGGMFIWKSWSGVPTVNVGGLTATLASEIDTVVSMKVDKTLGQKSITIDGATTYGALSSFANLNIYVLSVNNGGTPSSNQSYVKFYYVNISKGGTLLARLLPCKRNSDDAIGMYDTVRNTFYPVTSGVAEVGGAIEIPKGHYYITSTAGTQFGIHFEVGDWIISTGTSWSKVNNTDAVSSVEGRTGNVTVINDNASTGATTYTWSADKLETKFGSLGTAAYTATTDYATAAQGAKADTALQPADVVEYTANEVETLWNSI